MESDYTSYDALELLARGISDDQACGHCEGDCSSCRQDAADVLGLVRAEVLREAAEESEQITCEGHGGNDWFPSEWAGQVAGWLEHRAARIEVAA